MWFRVASVVVDMFHVVPCGQRGIRDVFRAASMVVEVFEMFHVLSCGQGPEVYSKCFMWFRVASVVIEIIKVVS